MSAAVEFLQRDLAHSSPLLDAAGRTFFESTDRSGAMPAVVVKEPADFGSLCMKAQDFSKTIVPLNRSPSR